MWGGALAVAVDRVADVVLRLAPFVLQVALDLLPVLRDTGCLFVTSAVESVQHPDRQGRPGP